MRKRISRAAGAIAACVVAASADPVSASAGSGIRFGGTDGRLHPFLDYETRYDTNVSYGAGNKAVGDMVLHIRPGLEVKIPGDFALVELSGALDWAQYLGTTEASTRDLSRMYADAGVAAMLNPRGAVSLRLDDDFRRQVSTSSLTLGSAVIANTNTLSLSVPWKPGGGALVLTFRGQWTLESLQQYLKDSQCSAGDPACSSGTLGDLGYNDFRTGLEAQWRFLPRTSAVFQAGFYSHMPNAKAVVLTDPYGTQTSMALAEVSGVDVLAGVTGLVTPHVGVSLKAGYGQAFETGGNTSSFLADVGAEWIPMESVSLRSGFTRAFGVDPLASVYTANGVYVTGRVRALQRYAFSTTFRYDHLAFAKLDGNTAFMRVEPGIEANIAKWMKASVGYAYSSRDSSLAPTDAMTLPPAAEASLAQSYSKNEAWLRLGFTY